MLTSLFNGKLPKAIFFDLDGTLIDSLPDLAVATDRMLGELNFEPAGIDKVRRWLGNGAEKLAYRALADAKGIEENAITQSELKQGLELILMHYAKCNGLHSTLYPDVIETLSTLQTQGLRFCIITNKPEQFTPTVLMEHDLFDFFELVLSGDTLPEKKPSPEPLLYALKKFGLTKDQVAMVGDSSSDILAANAAGIKSVCVTYGYNHGNDPKDLPASCHIDSFAELLK